MKILLFITTILFFAGNRSIAQNGKLEIRFRHSVGSSVLISDSVYVNSFNEKFSINKLKYYVSNFSLSKTSNLQQLRISHECFLINEGEPSTKSIQLKIPAGEYSSIQFILGVDSIQNISGAQTGALDPLNDMFWTWNTGYVMAKLEGNSPLSKLSQQMIEYHIGGFRGQYAVQQKVQLKFPVVQKIRNNQTTVLIVNADVLKWFNGKHNLRVAEYNACTSPGALALRYAENYATMFSIFSLKKP